MIDNNLVKAAGLRTIRRGLQLLCLSGVMFAFSPPAPGADPPREDKITFAITSADGLLEDLEFMVKDLAKKRREWNDDIRPNIELFLEGVDTTKPVRIDLFFDEKLAEYYRPFFPVSNLKSFRDNLDALGVTSKQMARDLFLLESAFDGQMRLIKENYAVFAPQEQLSIIPADLPEPRIAIKELVAPRYDAGVKIDNDPAGIQRRRDSLKKVISNAMDEVKKKSTESPEEYELRRLLARNQLTKLENLYAEIALLQAGWVTDVEGREGRGDFQLRALPGTPLASGLEKIPELKSRFAAIPPTEKFVATGRLQIPLTPQRQERLASSYNAYRPVINQRIDNNQELDAFQKKASKQAVAKTLELLEKGFQLGMVDAFLEMRKGSSPNMQEAIGGIQVVDGKEVEEVIKLLPEVYSRFVVKMNAATEGQFQIHEIALEDRVPSMLESLFGVPCKVTVATSETLLLVGFGDNAGPWLLETARLLNTQTEPSPLANCLEFKGHMEAFARALNTLEPNKDRPELRGMLVQAFSQGDDYVELSNTYTDGVLHGRARVETGLLRFLGLAVAKFAEENL